MKISDLIRLSLDNLRRRKGRTVLTVIGVVVGVCAIVVMISLGIAVNRATDDMLQNWGDLTKITVNSWGAQQGTPDLDDKIVAELKQIPNVVAATPLYSPRSFYGNILGGRNGKYQSYASVVGIDPEAVEPMGYTLITGSQNLEQNFGKDKIPVLIGQQSVFNFYNPKKRWNSPDYQKYPKYDDSYTNILNMPQYDAEGNLLNPDEFFFDIMKTSLIYQVNIGNDEETGEPKYKEYELVPVGMISAGMSDYQISSGIIMSVENLKKIEEEYKRLTKSGSGSGGYSGGYMSFGGGDDGTTNVGGYDSVYVKVNDSANMNDVELAIKKIGYSISSMSETRKQLQGQVAQTQMMLGGLAAVSLLVAALNIMNTMTMAIYERTKEIGIMKVLGCKLGNIRTMFLIESGAIGFLGGLIGCSVSILLAFLLNNLPKIMAALGIDGNIDLASLFGVGGIANMGGDVKLAIIPPWLIFLALGFATAVGILSGIAPSNRAMKISSLEAIRHE